MQITTDTPTTEYTIAKHKFNVFKPFAEGSVLTPEEAAALNQTFAENIRNNFATKIKEHEEAGTFDETAIQAALDAYQETYVFGKRPGRPGGAGSHTGSRKSDPVKTRAMELARAAVRRKIVEVGGNLKDYPAKDISARAAKALESNPKFLETAARQLSEEDLDVGDIGPSELDSAQAVEEAPAVKRSPKAAAA